MGAPKAPQPSPEEQEEAAELRADRKRLKAQELAERKEIAEREVDQLRRVKRGFITGRRPGSAPQPLTPANGASSPSSLFNPDTPF